MKAMTCSGAAGLNTLLTVDVLLRCPLRHPLRKRVRDVWVLSVQRQVGQGLARSQLVFALLFLFVEGSRTGQGRTEGEATWIGGLG